MGFAGTGSKNSMATDPFVPAHRVVAATDFVGRNKIRRQGPQQSALSAVDAFGIAICACPPLLGAVEGTVGIKR
jgi:hypothetical protein